MFDKEKEFEAIEEKLNEARIACNRAQIPFIWVAAIKDNKKSTEYRASVDENEAPGLDVAKYRCHALVPGSMGIRLCDDKIRDIIKVLNGFKVVAKNTGMAIDTEEFAHSQFFPEKNSIYRFDESEGAYVMRDTAVGEGNKDIEKEENREGPIVLIIHTENVLPRIEEDFNL